MDRLLPSSGPGAQRLREVLGTAFAQRARQRGLRNALITSSVGDLYEGTYAEQLLALLHTEVPSVMDRSPESLPLIDWDSWHMSWGDRFTPEQRARIIPALGAYLGMLLVYTLGGKWMPRRNLPPWTTP